MEFLFSNLNLTHEEMCHLLKIIPFETIEAKEKIEKFEQYFRMMLKIHGQILMETLKNEKLKTVYKGYQISYNDDELKIDPDILFIGFNSGVSYSKKNQDQIIEKFKPLEEHELNILSKEVITCFSEAGKKIILDNTVAIGCCFFSTNSNEELKVFMDNLPEHLREIVQVMSIIWTRNLINFINPKIVICLGDESFYYLRDIVYYNEITVIENKNPPLEAKIENIPIISSQRTGSTMIHKDLLIKKLKEYYETK